MALIFRNHALFRLCGRKIFVGPFSIYKNKSDKILDFEDDSLDEFTSQLIRRKIDKWNIKCIAQRLPKEKSTCIYKEVNSIPNIKHLNEDRINALFQQTIEIEDNEMVMDLILQCIKYKKCPSLSNVTYVLSLCAQSGDKKMVVSISDFCKGMMPSISKANSYFKHFLAEAIWVKGNSFDSLKLFEEVYKDNAYLRRRIRLTLKCLMNDVTSERSEPALANLIKFSEKIFIDYQDIFPLTCVWQTCFLSEWFHDQRLALNLLEQHDNLRWAATCRMPYVVAISLGSHRTEVVYRLLEILLKYDMKHHYSGIILALFNYHFQHSDLKNCLEIVKWSFEYDVTLPAVQHKQFLDLVLKSNKEELLDLKTLYKHKKSVFKTEFKF